MSDKDGKTEKPTPKKLKDARKKGQIAKSQDLSSAISFGLFALLSAMIATYVFQYSLVYLKNALSRPIDLYGFANNLPQLGFQSIIAMFILASPFLLIAFFSGVVGNMAQVGFHFSWDSIKPDFKRLNPIEGAKNILSKKTVVGLIKNLAKLGLVGWITFNALEKNLPLLFQAGNAGMERLFFLAVTLMRDLAINLAIFLGIVGIADYAFQVYDHRKNLSMSKQEIKEEYKDMEGDQQIKSQRKQRHRDLVNGNMADVKDAAAVIVNPTHISIAIKYEQGTDDVPIVAVKGADIMAKRIREEAKEHGVQIIENKAVARALYKICKPGQPVPPDMYQAIAEILALVYQIEEQNKHKI